jgi:hypothetical protein
MHDFASQGPVLQSSPFSPPPDLVSIGAVD